MDSTSTSNEPPDYPNGHNEAASSNIRIRPKRELCDHDLGDGVANTASCFPSSSNQSVAQNVGSDNQSVSQNLTEVDSLKNQIAQLQRLLSKAEEKLESERATVAGKDESLKRARDAAKESMEQVGTISLRNAELTRKLEEEEAIKDDLKRKVERLDELLEKERDNANLSDRCSELEEMVETEKRQRLQQLEEHPEYINQKKSIESLRKKLKKERSELADCQKKVEITNTDNESLGRQLAELERKNKEKLEGMSLTMANQQKEIGILKESVRGKEELETLCKNYQDFVANLLSRFRQVTELLESSIQGTVSVNCDGDSSRGTDRKRLEELCTDIGNSFQDLQSDQERGTEELGQINSNLKRLLKRLASEATHKSLFQESLEKNKSLEKRVKELEAGNSEQKDKIDELEKSVEEKERKRLEAEMKWWKLEKTYLASTNSSSSSVPSVSTINLLTTPASDSTSTPESVHLMDVELNEEVLPHCNEELPTSSSNQPDSTLETYEASGDQQQGNLTQMEAIATSDSTGSSNQLNPVSGNERQNQIHGEDLSKSHERFFCLCGRETENKRRLHKHIQYHTGERNFACHVCDKRFVYESYLRQHEKRSHNGASSKKSKNLKRKRRPRKSFGRKRSRKTQSKKCVEDIPYAGNDSCSGNDDAFANMEPMTGQGQNQDELGQHTILSRIENCGGKTGTQSSSRNLTRPHHGVDVSKATTGHFCVCGKESPNKGALHKHIQHYIQVCRFSCERCGKSFRSTFQLAAHAKKMYKIEYKRIGCRTCGNTFSSWGELLHHQKTKGCSRLASIEAAQGQMEALPQTSQASHGHKSCEVGSNSKHAEDVSKTQAGSEERFCTCRKKFKTRNGLMGHIRWTRAKAVVSQKKMFECNVCQQRFVYHGDLQKHFKRRHKITNSRSKGYFGCQFCGDLFPNLLELRQHRKRAHPNEIGKRTQVMAGRTSRKIMNRDGESAHARDVLRSEYQSEPLEYPKKQSQNLTSASTPSATSSGNHALHEQKHAVDIRPLDQGHHCICGKSFETKEYLRHHLIYYSSEGKFKCTSCEGRFPFFSLWKRHMSRSHRVPDAELDILKHCKYSGHIFSSNSELSTHCKSYHSHPPGSGPTIVQSTSESNSSSIKTKTSKLTIVDVCTLHHSKSQINTSNRNPTQFSPVERDMDNDLRLHSVPDPPVRLNGSFCDEGDLSQYEMTTLNVV